MMSYFDMITILKTVATIFCICQFCFVDQSFAECKLSNGTILPVDSVWTNVQGCQCQCVKYLEMKFQICNDCSDKLKKYTITSSIKNTCVTNGFHYLENETWMSPFEACTKCQCHAGGKYTCVKEKHCSNTCYEGQIPKYGACCEVEKCLGNATAVYSSLPCWDEQRQANVIHGNSIVLTKKCIDNICVCYSGIWKCHDFCKISSTSLLVYWNKLCCPRPKYNESCTYKNKSIESEGTVLFEETNQNCTCLQNQVYCSRTSPAMGITQWVMNTSTAPSTSSYSILITLLVLILFIICCLIVIILFANFYKKKHKNLLIEENSNRILLSDYAKDADIDGPSHIDHI